VRDLLVRRALHQSFDVLEITDTQPGSLLLRHARLLPRLLRALRTDHDVLFVGFYGQLLATLLGRLTRKPVILDAFLSTWDTMCFDRRKFGPHSVPGRVAYWLDQHSCRYARHSLLDTETHAAYFARTFDLPRAKLSAYYVGFDDQLFRPLPAEGAAGRFNVFFYGSFVPLQGVEHIVDAAAALRSESDIDFHIVGEGFTYPQVRRHADELGLERLHFQAPVPYQQLPQAIARASICLGGPFGSSGKARRVIAGKTYQFLAMGKPTIVGDSEANKELFRDREHVLMCKMADGEALASAIRELKQDQELREGIARQGHQYCTEEFDIRRQSERLESIILSAL